MLLACSPLDPGISAQDFKQKYANGSLAAVSQVSGVPESSIKSAINPAGSSPGSSSSSGARRLLQQQAGSGTGSNSSDTVNVAYQITADDPAAALKGINDATANGGSGFFAALDAHGVPLRPAIKLDGKTAVSLEEAAAAAASASRNLPPTAGSESSSNRRGWPLWKQLVVGLCVGVVGALLLAVLAGCLLKRRKVDKVRRKEAEIIAIDTQQPRTFSDVPAAGGDQPGTRLGKAEEGAR